MSTGHSRHAPGSVWHLVESGANLPKLATVVVHVLPVLCLPVCPLADGSTAASSLFFRNAALQLAIFLPLVQLPAAVTGKMGYVDIGWPLGLLAAGLLVLWDVVSQGDAVTQTDARDPAQPLRAVLAGLVMVLHGGRMFCGAVVMFFPYDFKDGDLARYRFAQVRFTEFCGMPSRLWPVKLQHDLLQQAFANAVPIGALVCLLAGDFFRTASSVPVAPIGTWSQLTGKLWELAQLWPELYGLEIAGFVGWLAFWQVENVADAQKSLFLYRVRGQSGQGKGQQGSKPTLGHPPFDGPEFCLWTLCRHPNYFCEWMSWNCLILASLPSLLRFPLPTRVLLGSVPLRRGARLVLPAAVPVPAWAVRLAVLGILGLLSLMLHNCLNWWTGAAPAEYWSARGQRGESYRQYQEAVRCFWPLEVPWVDHRRLAGWPCCEEGREKKRP